jgi:hypothetical protein
LRRKLIIASSGLQSRSSHPLNELLGHRQAAAALGLSATILIPRHGPRDLTEMVGAKPVLDPFPPLPRFRPDRAVSQLVAFATGPSRVASLWAAIDREGPTGSDLILFPAANPVLIVAAGRWLAGRDQTNRPAVFFRFFGRDLKDDQGERFGGAAVFYRLACEQLRGAPGQERLFLLADNERGARMINRAAARRAFVTPMPKPLSHPPGRLAPRDEAVRQTVYVHMNARSVDVYPLLEEVFQDVRVHYPAVRFLIKQTATLKVDRTIEPVRGFVEWLPTEQDLSDYLENFQRTGVALLAYGPDDYRASTSGVFIEAASVGSLIVAPAETWMAEQMDAGVGVGTTFDHTSSASISDALLRVLGSRETLFPLANSAAERVRAENTCEKYIEKMIELAASGAAMEPIYELGDCIDFGDPLEVRQFLGAGWAEIEDWGVWTNDSTAALSFRLAGALRQPARLRVLAHAFLHPSRPRVTVRVAIGDRNVSEWVFDRDDPQTVRWCEAPLPPDVGSEFEVSFAIDRPASPHSLGLSADRRTLGFGLHKLTIEAHAASSAKRLG